MDLEKRAMIISDIRTELSKRVNTRLKVRANMGRSKIVECVGTLMQAHPSLFIMEIDQRRGRKSRQSYQYVDILTGMVELRDAETGEPIFEPFVEPDPSALPVDHDDEEDEDEDM